MNPLFQEFPGIIQSFLIDNSYTFCCFAQARRVSVNIWTFGARSGHQHGPSRPHLLVLCTCHVIPVRNNHGILVLTLQGIVGNLSSGKSALVHRYLTGTYVQEESPEGKSAPTVLTYDLSHLF